MKYRNIKNLKAWLDRTLKQPYGSYDLDAVLEDVEKQYQTSGYKVYELSSTETNSGLTEYYAYAADEIYDENTGTYETIFIF